MMFTLDIFVLDYGKEDIKIHFEGLSLVAKTKTNSI